MGNKQIIVVKIGGVALGSNDTTIEDIVYLQQQGRKLVVVHGGGKLITEWLKIHRQRFAGGGDCGDGRPGQQGNRGRDKSAGR
jgi:uridylate kinase